MAAVSDVDVPVPPDADSIQCIAFDPKKEKFAGGFWDSMVRLWDIKRPGAGKKPTACQPLTQINMNAPVLDCCFDHEGDNLFVGTCANNLLAVDMKTQSINQIAQWIKDKQSVVVGSWDRTVRYYDVRQSEPFQVSLPERVYAMDMKWPLLLVATAGGGILLYDLKNPREPTRQMLSPLKWQTRSVRLFHNKEGFGITSIEGRVGIRYVRPDTDNTKGFAFKCHRDGPNVFAVNSIDFHPNVGAFSYAFASAGDDGRILYWDKDKKKTLFEFPRQDQSVVAAQWNHSGDLYAYAMSYNWNQGAAGFKQMPSSIKLHYTLKSDLSRK